MGKPPWIRLALAVATAKALVAWALANDLVGGVVLARSASPSRPCRGASYASAGGGGWGRWSAD
jgi:hypothetical protein